MQELHDNPKTNMLRKADRLADYEDEIRRLKATKQEEESKAFATPPPDVLPQIQAQLPAQAGRLTTLASFLPGRRGSPSNPPTPGLPPTQASHAASGSLGAADSSDLPAQLIREKALREKAESSLKAAHSELEELTAQLFGQANEMVATERKARARLEERVELLEKRDVEKRRRLERLEGAVRRIERVRGLVSGSGGA